MMIIANSAVLTTQCASSITAGSEIDNGTLCKQMEDVKWLAAGCDESSKIALICWDTLPKQEIAGLSGTPLPAEIRILAVSSD